MKDVVCRVTCVVFLLVACTLTVRADSLTWNAGSDSNWDTTTANWSGDTWDSGVPDDAVFGDTGAGTITLTEAITAGAVTFNNTAGYTLSQSSGSLSFTTINSTGSGQVYFNGGVLAGSGTITNTTGRLVVYGDNSSYSGTINHLSGAENLYVNNANSLGMGTLNLSGGFLTCDNSPTLNSTLTINATGGRLGGAGVNDQLRISGTVNFNSGGSGVTFNNSINNRSLAFRSGATVGGDAASVSVGRATTYIDAGVNWNYGGDLRIVRTGNGASVLNLGNGIDLSSTGSDNRIINVEGNDSNARIVQVSAGGASAKIGDVLLQENTDGTFDLNVGANSTLTVSGVISSDANGSGIDLTGAGTVILSGANTFGARTSVQAGTLQLASTGSLACNVISVASGATCDVFDGYVAASGKTISGAGTLRASGNIDFEAGSTVTVNTLEVAGGIASNVVSTGISRLEVSGGSVAIDGAKNLSEIEIPDSSTGSVTIDAAGVTTDTLTLSGDGTLDASVNALTINAGGTVTDSGSSATIEADAAVALSLQGDNLASSVSDRTLTLSGGTTAIYGASSGGDMGATLNYDAASDTDGDASGESTTAIQSLNWTLGANVTRTTTLTGAPTGITAAYDFPTSGSNVGDNKATAGTFSGPVAVNADATWEFWLQADDLTTNQTLWESGGAADGAGLVLQSNGEILFIAKDGVASLIVTNAFPSDGDFHQIVVTLDMDASGSTDSLKMYIDGALVDTDESETGVAVWSGGDDSGLGGYGGNDTGGRNGDAGDINFGTFDGKLAIMRFYEGTALDAAGVTAKYDAVAGVSLSNTAIHVAADSTIDLNGSFSAELGDLSFSGLGVTLTVTNDTYDAVSDVVSQWDAQGGIGYAEYNTGGDSYATFWLLPKGTIVSIH